MVCKGTAFPAFNASYIVSRSPTLSTLKDDIREVKRDELHTSPTDNIEVAKQPVRRRNAHKHLFAKPHPIVPATSAPPCSQGIVANSHQIGKPASHGVRIPVRLDRDASLATYGWSTTRFLIFVRYAALA